MVISSRNWTKLRWDHPCHKRNPFKKIEFQSIRHDRHIKSSMGIFFKSPSHRQCGDFSCRTKMPARIRRFLFLHPSDTVTSLPLLSGPRYGHPFGAFFMPDQDAGSNSAISLPPPK
jgi:hypothetical protein